MDRSLSLLPALIACFAILGSAMGCPSEKAAGSKSVFIIEVEPGHDENGAPLPVTKETLKRSLSSLEKRLKRSGHSDYRLKTLKENQLSVEFPAIKTDDRKNLRSLLTRTAKLELKKVHPDNKTIVKKIATGEEAAPPGYKLYSLPIYDPAGKKTGERPILLSRRNIIGGGDIQTAFADPGRFGSISVLLTPNGGNRLGEATERMTKGVDRLGIVLDNEGLIAPTVQGNLRRNFVIQGLDGEDEVRQVVFALNNPLLNNLKIISEKEIPVKQGKE